MEKNERINIVSADSLCHGLMADVVCSLNLHMIEALIYTQLIQIKYASLLALVVYLKSTAKPAVLEMNHELTSYV